MLESIRGHHIWTAPLRPNSVVVDAGAHRGEFSAELIQRFGCRCHLVEANPALAARLNVSEVASITSAALGARDGHANFHVRANPESGSIIGDAGASLETVPVEIVSLPTLMKRIHVEHIDVLKLDIEGAEFELVEHTPDDVWKRVGQITVEFHDFQPHYSGRGLFEAARARLERLGFVCCLMSFRTHGDVLFLNRERLNIGFLRSVYASRLARYPAKFRALSK